MSPSATSLRRSSSLDRTHARTCSHRTRTALAPHSHASPRSPSSPSNASHRTTRLHSHLPAHTHRTRRSAYTRTIPQLHLHRRRHRQRRGGRRADDDGAGRRQHPTHRVRLHATICTVHLRAGRVGGPRGDRPDHAGAQATRGTRELLDCCLQYPGRGRRGGVWVDVLDRVHYRPGHHHPRGWPAADRGMHPRRVRVFCPHRARDGGGGERPLDLGESEREREGKREREESK